MNKRQSNRPDPLLHAISDKGPKPAPASQESQNIQRIKIRTMKTGNVKSEGYPGLGDIHLLFRLAATDLSRLRRDIGNRVWFAGVGSE